ncbi:MAG TPA: hypothetical protein VNQ76_07760 [Planctomicrobium sp.]|nr:hypothetical protein [Planctomicrobium sp.]
MRRLLLIVLIVSVMQMEGCSEPREIPGGTPGIIRIDSKGIADVQVTAYRKNQDQRFEPVAIGISGRNGEFELRKQDALEAVWLEPGEYRFTVESIGDIHIPWSPEFRNPEKTSLRQTRTDQDHKKLIELSVPDPTPKNR